MSMIYISYTSLVDGLNAMKDFLIDRPESAPSEIRDLMRAQNADLGSYFELLQTIYDAPRDMGSTTTVGPILMQIAASCLMVFDLNNFLAQGRNDASGTSVAARMSLALRRDSGELPSMFAEWPDPMNDPPRTKSGE